jgi:undecaprenyl-diphosphatase
MPEWIQSIDDQVLHWFQEHHTKWLDYNLQQVTALGSTTVLGLLSLFVIGLLLLDRKLARAVLVAAILIGAFYATDAIKEAVARPRPVLGHSGKAASASASFPSSHASLSMTAFLVSVLCLRDLGRRAGLRGACAYAVLWAFGLAVAVGVSRLCFGNHFLSDVIGGWLLGVGLAIVYLGGHRLTG